MATIIATPTTFAEPRTHARHLHYRGLTVRPEHLRKADAPRAGRRMFWRGISFDGALLDAQAKVRPARRRQFYRGVYF